MGESTKREPIEFEGTAPHAPTESPAASREAETETAVEIRVYGRVQGVCFRDSACREAARLGVRGTVRNESDGSVFSRAEGTEDALRDFVSWCAKGPRHARVDRVDTCPVDAVGAVGFRIEFPG